MLFILNCNTGVKREHGAAEISNITKMKKKGKQVYRLFAGHRPLLEPARKKKQHRTRRKCNRKDTFTGKDKLISFV